MMGSDDYIGESGSKYRLDIDNINKLKKKKSLIKACCSSTLQQQQELDNIINNNIKKNNYNSTSNEYPNNTLSSNTLQAKQIELYTRLEDTYLLKWLDLLISQDKEPYRVILAFLFMYGIGYPGLFAEILWKQRGSIMFYINELEKLVMVELPTGMERDTFLMKCQKARGLTDRMRDRMKPYQLTIICEPFITAYLSSSDGKWDIKPVLWERIERYGRSLEKQMEYVGEVVKGEAKPLDLEELADLLWERINDPVHYTEQFNRNWLDTQGEKHGLSGNELKGQLLGILRGRGIDVSR